MSKTASSAITFCTSHTAAKKGTRRILFVGTRKRLRDKQWLATLGDAAAVVDQMAKDTAPGDHGAAASTLHGNAGARVAVGVLPERVSRYNCAARSEGIRRVVAAAHGRRTGGTGIVLLLDDADHLIPAANAVARAIPLLDRRSTTGKATPSNPIKVCALGPDGRALRATTTLRETVEATRMAARLVDTPPTELHPGAMAAEARRLLRGIEHVKIREIVGDRLLTSKLGGLHAVGRTAVEAPRLVIASYAPPGARGPRVALVGKGITYDTGGLHVKMRGSMEGMKCDMGGAAAVLGAFRVLAATGTRRRIDLLLCLAENAIGPTAYKPDDILTMHSGKTVEINNTDAEGRLVLADGVSWAARKLGADVVLDAATLTGAQMVATGVMHAALISNDAKLEATAVAAGHASGDLVHPLPFAPELYRQEFRSPVADMRNSVKNRANAQTSCAAEFIHWHLEGTKARWAHVDLAGPAWRADRGTGFGVALLAELARRA